MRRNVVKTIVYILAICLIVFTVITFANSWQDIKKLDLKNPWWLIAILPVLGVNLYATGRLFDTAIKAHKVHLKKTESFGLASLARFGNYISFGQLGFGIRVYYLKKKHSMKYSHSLSGLSVSNIIFYLTIATVAFVSSVLVAKNSVLGNVIMFAVIIFFGFIVVALLILKYQDKVSSHRYISRLITPSIRSYVSSVKSITKSGSLIFNSFFWAFIMLISFTLILQLEFVVLGSSINFLDSLFISSVSSLTGLINITPAGIGINEGLLLVAGKAINVPSDLLLGAAILRRVVVFTTVLMLSIHFSKSIFDLKLRDLLKKLRSLTKQSQ